jgi:integrator complex subunit 4
VQQQHYAVACASLADDNEAVRTVALNMVTVVSAAHPDQMVASQNADMVPRRMIDDAFATVCNSLTDLSVAVRVHAAQLLGKMRGVSEDFLLQTFDKKVMSHLRKKKTEHELIKDKARAAHTSPHVPTSAHLHISHLGGC